MKLIVTGDPGWIDEVTVWRTLNEITQYDPTTGKAAQATIVIIDSPGLSGIVKAWAHYNNHVIESYVPNVQAYGADALEIIHGTILAMGANMVVTFGDSDLAEYAVAVNLPVYRVQNAIQ